MSAFSTIAVVVTTAATVTGLVTAFAPPTPDRRDRARELTQRHLSDLADAHERETDRYRREGKLHGETENRRRLSSAERRPPAPRIRVIP